jgi:hypothetical protein
METGVTDAGAPAFEAEVTIGRGWRTLDRKGRLTIAGGKLRLSDRDGRRIAEAPASEVYAKPSRLSAGAGATVTVGGTKYSVVALAVSTYNSAELSGSALRLGGSASSMGMAGSAIKLAGDISKIRRGREMTRTVLAAIRAAGGQVSFG